MKVAIIGGGGCFALNFAKHLDGKGIAHFGIGRSNKPPALWPIEHHYRYWKLHIVDELPAVMAVLDTERPDVIVNFAAQGEGAASFGENAPDFFRTNAEGLVRLVVELNKRAYFKRFVQIGSSEVYGSVEKPSKESDPLNPSSPYAISKAAFDQYLVTMGKMGFPMNIVRPSNCYTPGQQLHRIIPKAILCALKGVKLPLQGGGVAQKSYLHADDLSSAVLAVLERGTVGAVYNVGPRVPISIRTLVMYVASACGVAFSELVEEAPERTGQDGKYWLDSTAIARDCGWTQTVGLEKGIEDMIAWVKKYPELMAMPTSYTHCQ